MGPVPEVKDQGAKMISALAAILALDEEQKLSESDVNKLMAKVKDPVGTFYMYGLASATVNTRTQR